MPCLGLEPWISGAVKMALLIPGRHGDLDCMVQGLGFRSGFCSRPSFSDPCLARTEVTEGMEKEIETIQTLNPKP